MKTIFARFTILAFTLFSLPLARSAMDPAVISADAKWVAYADLNALRSSAVGRELIAAAEKAQLSKTHGKFGVDLEKVLAMIESATAYGANFSEDPNLRDGTLIVQGTNDLRKIAEGLLLQQTMVAPSHVVELTNLPFPAYGIKIFQGKSRADPAEDDKNDSQAEKSVGNSEVDKIELLIAFPPEPIVIVTKSKEQLIRAREVFLGPSANSIRCRCSPPRNTTAPWAASAWIVPSTTDCASGFPAINCSKARRSTPCKSRKS